MQVSVAQQGDRPSQFPLPDALQSDLINQADVEIGPLRAFGIVFVVPAVPVDVRVLGFIDNIPPPVEDGHLHFFHGCVREGIKGVDISIEIRGEYIRQMIG